MIWEYPIFGNIQINLKVMHFWACKTQMPCGDTSQLSPWTCTQTNEQTTLLRKSTSTLYSKSLKKSSMSTNLSEIFDIFSTTHPHQWPPPPLRWGGQCSWCKHQQPTCCWTDGSAKVWRSFSPWTSFWDYEIPIPFQKIGILLTLVHTTTKKHKDTQLSYAECKGLELIFVILIHFNLGWKDLLGQITSQRLLFYQSRQET